MADELKELTAQLDQDVLTRVDELKRSLDAWLSEIHTASDPVSPLISDKGVWVLTSPLINTKPLIKSALRIFARDLAEKSSAATGLAKFAWTGRSSTPPSAETDGC